MSVGVSQERFWLLTPAELQLEAEVYEKRQELIDYRIGLLCSVIAEPHRDEKKHPEPFTAKDFMPVKGDQKKEEKPQTWQEMLAIVELMNTALGGTDKR